MTEESSVALVPTEVREITFYEDILLVALVNGIPYVALRPITDFLGLTWSAQYRRVQRDEILVVEAKLVFMRGSDGKQYEMLSLPLEFLPGWLFGITVSKVRPELAEKLTRYRRECFQTLWQAFQDESLQSEDMVDASSASIVALEQIREMGMAVARMAEQQIEMEQRLNKRLDRAAHVVGDIQRRLGVVEQKLSPIMIVTEEQAETISVTVKALAELMSSKDSSKNHYQGIFAELYRRFGVSSYKNIRIERYQDVLTFLEDWRQSL